MRVAYNEATCKERSSLETDLRLCKKYAVEQIELRFDLIERYLQNHTPTDMRALVAASGVRPVALNAIFNINFLDEEGKTSIGRQMTRACEIGKLLGVGCLIALPSAGEDLHPHSWPEIVEDSLRNLRWMAGMSADCGMRIAFEPIGARERCVRSIREAWEIVRLADSESIGLTLDAYNLYLYNGLRDVSDLDAIDPNKIFTVHIDDADGGKAFDALGTFDRKLPGDGCIDLDAFVGRLENIGYRGPYSIELLNQEYWRREPESFFVEALEKSRALIDRCERKR